MDPKLIREKLGLAPEATDEEVFAKITALNEAATAAETRATDAENAKQTAETAADEEKKAKDAMAATLATTEAQANSAILDLAEREGKITKAERPAWEAKLAGEKRDEAVNSLTALKPKLNTLPLGGGQSREDREKSDNLREQVANAVAEIQEKRGLSYVDAWGEVKKDARFTAYFQG